MDKADAVPTLPNRAEGEAMTQTIYFGCRLK